MPPHVEQAQESMVDVALSVHVKEFALHDVATGTVKLMQFVVLCANHCYISPLSCVIQRCLCNKQTTKVKSRNLGI